MNRENNNVSMVNFVNLYVQYECITQTALSYLKQQILYHSLRFKVLLIKRQNKLIIQMLEVKISNKRMWSFDL